MHDLLQFDWGARLQILSISLTPNLVLTIASRLGLMTTKFRR
jgi:hypothetical protein